MEYEAGHIQVSPYPGFWTRIRTVPAVLLLSSLASQVAAIRADPSLAQQAGSGSPPL